jgi:general nucleoside transport system permease protein
MTQQQRLVRLILTPLPLIAALLAILLLMLLLQQFGVIPATPLELLEAFWKSISTRGELSTRKIASVVEFWIPLVLVSMGLVLTFRAGLWNIGVEGQMVMGGLFAAGFVFSSGVSDPVISVLLSVVAAMVGGGLWAALAGILKTRFGVNEIFSGVALNALANQITLQLIVGPWRPTDSDKAQYSRDFPDYAMLPAMARDFDVSLLAILLSLISVGLVLYLIWQTRWGLNLKATGRNARSALLLGVPVGASAISAMVICGALAGIGGMHRVLFTYDHVRSGFSGQIGFLGLLVVLLVGSRSWLVPIVALIFSLILAGSTQLQFLNVDTSLTGVLQGALVLLVLLFSGWRDRLQQRIGTTDTSDDASQPQPAHAPTKTERYTHEN